ncbi:hypothetical protein L1987_48378 [Smallanthus sonchifolius]|uniref:Uncharacterized protein n=1 Tax=Smallanthus sonchifolius TaxID=185202 RepID=A0ACB9FRU6_9ASTR|nr:hypothetical protein L1987_48378 [Smallanthus sonchifolius]
MWELGQWRYFAHILIMCISSRKAGKDALSHHLAAKMVGLSLNKGYNFSKWYCPESEHELSEHSNEQEEEEVEGDDDSKYEGDEEEGSTGAEESESEATEFDSSNAPDQSHPRRTIAVTLPESSAKRK